MRTDQQLTDCTIKIIKKGGHIFLRKGNGVANLDGKNFWYVHAWTNIAAGPDHAVWGNRHNALEFFNLKWALTIAPLYGAKVIVLYPKKKNA